MACSECKKKNEYKVGEDIIKSTKNVSTIILWGFVLWTLLGVYGLVCLISKFL